ncbi:MAG TPA: hypothetical protein VGG82_07665 [Casimicrobiaceae bacterium]|jgi:hypothetical protein
MTVTVNERTAPAAAGAPTDISQLFAAGVLTPAPTAVLGPLHSTADFEGAIEGGRNVNPVLWDYLDVAYRNGLTTAYVGGYDATGDFATGLGLFDPKLGPGQVTIVGETPAQAVQQAIADHVNAYNRIGLIDVGPTDADVATTTAHGDNAMAIVGSQENVGVFGSWINVAGPAGVVGSGGRVVPASAAIAGLCSLVDQAGNPNRAAGGRDFPLQYASSFVWDPNDSDRAACFQHGVNMFKDVYRVLENYGFVTPIPRDPSTPFWQLNCSRARMWLKAQCMAVGENYYMRTIDGQGKLAARFGADLALVCKDLHDAGGLYGNTPDEAYNINVSVTVNTAATAADATLKGIAEVKFSQYADTVVVDLVSVPIQGVIS